jgi:hypothetical protein
VACRPSAGRSTHAPVLGVKGACWSAVPPCKCVCAECEEMAQGFSFEGPGAREAPAGVSGTCRLAESAATVALPITRAPRHGRPTPAAVVICVDGAVTCGQQHNLKPAQSKPAPARAARLTAREMPTHGVVCTATCVVGGCLGAVPLLSAKNARAVKAGVQSQSLGQKNIVRLGHGAGLV